MFSRRTALISVVICCLAFSCSGASGRKPAERLAILPFENLTSSTDLDWISRLAAAILAYDLTGPRQIQPLKVGSIVDARLNRADVTMEGYFAREHNALAFHASIGGRTMIAMAQTDNIAAAMNRLAKEISPAARAVTGCDAAVLKAFGEDLEGKREFESGAHGGCVPVYLQLAEAQLTRGDRNAATSTCNTALALPKLDAIDRAQLDYLGALAKGDSVASMAALERLAGMLPSDAGLLRNAAELQFAHRNFQAAIAGFTAATRADPEDAAAWNDLGYVRALNHDLRGAVGALQNYMKLLPPENTNGLDSLGEVSFYLGDLRSAEQYFLEAHQKNPQAAGRELLKAAQARMMTGDLKGADDIFARGQNWTELDRAAWEFVTGRRKKAIARLEAASSNPAAALQLALWNNQTGHGPPLSPGSDPLSRAVAPLLSGQFHEAVPLLENLYRATNPGSDGQIRTLLAWAYARTGHPDNAAKLVDLYPIPLAGSGSNPVVASLVFPRFVQLRGELLHSEKDRQLGRLYAGDLPDRVQ